MSLLDHLHHQVMKLMMKYKNKFETLPIDSANYIETRGRESSWY